MRKKTLDLSFRAAYGAIFGHLGIGLQSFGGNFFPMEIQIRDQVVLPAVSLIYSPLNVDVELCDCIRL